MNINSYMPVRIVSGKNCVKDNTQLFSSFGKMCLIVTGGSSAVKSGALKDCTDALNEQNIKYSVFSGTEPNPLTSTCLEAGKQAHDLQCDFIIGIGGGSAQDAAKAVAIYAANPEFGHADIYNRTIPSQRLPVVLIGTTAGTGSEVTGVSVLTNSDTGMKKSISGPDCYSQVSFCDYTYTRSVPFDITVSAALDAFAHAVEAYLAQSANELVFEYSEKALRLLAPYIACFNDFSALSSEKAREDLYIASLFAGLAINIAGTDFPHTLGYYLTENYSIPHGRACTAFFPCLAERAKKYCPERFRAILTVLGKTSEELCECIKKATNVNISLSEEEAEKVSLRWKNGVKNFDRSPGGFTVSDARDALMSL